MSDGMQWIVRFELPNGGPGPDTVASDDLAGEFDAVVVLLLRDHYCQVSRERATAYSDAFDEFAAEDVAVVGALPDTAERAGYWRRRYELTYPVLADSAEGSAAVETEGATAMTDGTPRFDAFSDVEVGVDTLPGIGILDTRSKFPRLVHTEGGETLQECPSPIDALDAARDALET
ncbi:redoxin domain-containing protein [Halosimplex litoreum]|uniref:Redoxin domain-containing protein n=1 Tax=Halosimplex litoreum TaxID=1198301 RepID=A0A7U3WB93_9EURY|nr:redoxin domain-containing protein [Halosimplex litoreum]QPV64888.1 redoxin domain-containing protein [Halosimplex litoreum]